MLPHGDHLATKKEKQGINLSFWYCNVRKNRNSNRCDHSSTWSASSRSSHLSNIDTEKGGMASEWRNHSRETSDKLDNKIKGKATHHLLDEGANACHHQLPHGIHLNSSGIFIDTCHCIKHSIYLIQKHVCKLSTWLTKDPPISSLMYIRGNAASFIVKVAKNSNVILPFFGGGGGLITPPRIKGHTDEKHKTLKTSNPTWSTRFKS